MRGRDGINCIVIILGIILFLGITSTISNNENMEMQLILNEPNPDEISSIAYIPQDPILIDGDANFSDTALLEGWQGNGTIGNPFIIENLSIDSEGSATASVYILNTRVSFIIRNCRLGNATSAGVRLDNVTSGRIINNLCVGNYYGILINVATSAFCDIINNTCVSNTGTGIKLTLPNFINVINNTCNDNSYDGIGLQTSSFNTVSNNTCINNGRNGIQVASSSNTNTLDNNICSASIVNGIFLSSSNSNTLNNNTCSNNGEHGIYIYSSSSNIVNKSYCSDNFRDGIYLYSSSNSNTLNNNNCSANSRYGINLYSSSNYNTINNNTCKSNNGYGIITSGSSMFTTLNKNTCTDNIVAGISSMWADNNVVSNNTCKNNLFGIELHGSWYSSVFNNTCIDNGENGIYVVNGNNGILINNYCSDQVNGILVETSWLVTISNNTCNYNSKGIYVMSYTNHTITHNILIDNSYGIYFEDYAYWIDVHWNIISGNNEVRDYGQYTSVFEYNYYSNYGGVDINQDGIGDTPYVFASNSDPYPLMFWPTPPKWNETPTDRTITDLETLQYDLNTTTLAPISWTVNDTAHFTIDENGTLESLGTLMIGEYGLEVNVTNIYNFSIQAVFTVRVLPWDTTSPSWVDSPEDQVVEYATSFFYDLNATDPTGIDHWWVNSTDFTIDATGVISNATILSVGVYGLELYCNDTYGNTLSATISVTVEDTTPPTIEGDIQIILYYEFGEPFYYDANATDASGIDTWWFTLGHIDNLTIDADGVIRNASIVYEPAVGVVMKVNDTYGNEATKNVIFFVTDSILPSWVTTPENQVIEYSLPFSYDIDATDLAGISHWSLNSTDFSIDSEGVISNATFLDLGVYGLEIFVEDRHGNVESAIITVTVEDTTPPSWVTSPQNQVIEFGESFSYDLNAADLTGISHWWVNSSIFAINADGIITNATVLSIGVYGLEVFVEDNHGNVLSAVITVTVEESPVTTTTTPSITTSPTTSTTDTTTPTGTTPEGLDPMIIIALGGFGAMVVIIIIVVFVKKKT